MIESKILLKGEFYPENIIIETVAESKRKIDPEIEAKVESTWQEIEENAKKQGRLIFNGESFRLENFRLQGTTLKLTISKIQYKFRSSLNSLIDELYLKGEGYLTYGLAIGGFLETSDGKFVFGNKTGKTISTSTQDVIGGIVEPDELNNGQKLFECLFKEFKEEIDVDHDDVLETKIIGLVRSQTGNVVIVTSTSLNLTSIELQNKFESKPKEQFEEILSLEFVERKDLANHLKKWVVINQL